MPETKKKKIILEIGHLHRTIQKMFLFQENNFQIYK